jgi:hypothetical protein
MLEYNINKSFKNIFDLKFYFLFINFINLTIYIIMIIQFLLYSFQKFKI